MAKSCAFPSLGWWVWWLILDANLIPPERENLYCGTASIRLAWEHDCLQHFLDCQLMEESLAYCGWCHPCIGGPGVCKKARWASHGEAAQYTAFLHGLRFSSCLQVLDWVCALTCHSDKFWHGNFELKQTFSSPGWFYYRDRDQTRAVRAWEEGCAQECNALNTTIVSISEESSRRLTEE